MAHGGQAARTPAPAPASTGGSATAAIAGTQGPARASAPVRAHLARWRSVYLAFALSRLLVLAVGFGAELVMRMRDVDPATWRPFAHAETYPHYADVAANGYALANAFDFPLLPALMAAGASIGLPFALTAFVISNACFLAGLLAFAALGERVVGHAAALRAATYLAIAPFAYWFSIASTESLLLAAAGGSVLLALRATPAGWAGAGVLAAVAALSRPPGALLGLVLLCVAIGQLRDGRLDRRGIAAALAAGAAIPVALIAFFGYLRARTGDALATFHAQDQFDRHLSLDGPLQALASGARSAAGGSLGQMIELAATLGAAALVAWFAATALGSRWEVRGWTLFAVASLLLPLATGVLWQMPRFALLVPPVFWALGALGRRAWLHRVVLVLFPAALAVKVVTAVVGVQG